MRSDLASLRIEQASFDFRLIGGPFMQVTEGLPMKRLNTERLPRFSGSRCSVIFVAQNPDCTNTQHPQHTLASRVRGCRDPGFLLHD